MTCCVADDGPLEVDEDGYCVGCGTRRDDVQLSCGCINDCEGHRDDE